MTKRQDLVTIVTIAFVFVGRLILPGATYYTATDGDDINSGSAAQPWRTIQKAADSVVAGDTVIVRAGIYEEPRIETAVGGAHEANRVTFQAEGQATVQGFAIGHPYITVRGFDITGHSGTSTGNAHVGVGSDGDRFELIDCTIRDGIQITRADMTFSSADNTINSAMGGFLAARFAAGQTLYVGEATNGIAVAAANSGTHIITAVTDNSITVESSLVDEGPLFVYLSASFSWGLSLSSGAESCVIRSNTFRNLGYDTWFILGTGHLIEGNVIEQANGWDAMHFGGSDHVFRHNLIHNSPLIVYQVSPDSLENYPPAPYSNVVFSNNFIQGFTGVLASQKGQNTSSGLMFAHNVFVDVGRFSLTHPGTTFENNTFLSVAKESSPVHSRAPHPIYVRTSVGATNATIRNNIFVDCGEPSRSESRADVGWYEIDGPTDSVIAEGNFAAGGPSDFEAKNGWPEGIPNLNGGSPGFVNINDPLGPDGLPFTDDDGLRLLADSKLINAGAGGLTVGAYPMPVDAVRGLMVTGLIGGGARLSWPDMGQTWTLQSALSLAGDWTDVAETPQLVDGEYQLDIGTTEPAAFFRLRQ